MDVSLRSRVLPFVTHQDVPHHPDQLQDHEAGEEGHQVLLFDHAGAGHVGQHHRSPDQQQISPILSAEELRVLFRVVPRQTFFGDVLLVVLGAGRRRGAVAILVQAHNIQCAVLHHGGGWREITAPRLRVKAARAISAFEEGQVRNLLLQGGDSGA